MKYKYFEPPAGQAPVKLPTKEELLFQIESDHYAAKQRDDKDEIAALEERYTAVKSADDDASANDAYETAITYVPPEPEVAPETVEAE